MRRIMLLLVLLSGLLLGCSSQPKSFVWQQVDTRVEVRSDGLLDVTETLTLRYSGGPFTFVYRDLANRRLDAISNISVSDADRSYQLVDDAESEQPYTFSVSSEDNTQRVRWVYPATSDSERTFVLRYQVAGAIWRADNTDQLWWSLVFSEREEPVERATGRIVLPQAVPVAQMAASTPDAAGTLELAPGEVFVQSGGIPAGSELTLLLRFPKGIVAGGVPAWQAAEAAQQDYNSTTRPTVNLLLSLATALLALLLGWLTWNWWRRNRDPQPRGIPASELPAAPDELPAALAAKLLGSGEGQAFLAILFDLGNRGYLVFREQPGGWNGKTPQIVVTRGEQQPADLTSYEAAVFEALFSKRDQVVLDGSHTEITEILAKLGKQTQAALLERELLDPQRLARRNQGLFWSGLLSALGGLALIPAFILAERLSWWLPPLAGALLIPALTWLVLAASIRGFSQAGADAHASWTAFQRYLKRIQPAAAPAGQFSQLLPYAVALGDARALTRSYAASAEPLPIWYYPILTSGAHSGDASGAATLSHSLLLQDFSQNFLASLNSASSSVASSGAAAGAGAGGASGGGGGGAG